MYNQEYGMILAEERAIAIVQAMAIRLLEEKKIRQSDLATTLQLSEARVSQIFAGEPRNLTLKKAAQLFFAMNEELVFSCKTIDEMNQRAEKRNRETAFLIRDKKETFTWALKAPPSPANSFEEDIYSLEAA